MKQYLVIAWAILLLVGSNLAQAEQSSPTAEALRSRVKSGDVEAIIAAGRTKDPTLVPYLEKLAAKTKQRANENSVAFNAHVALALIGDDKSLREILEETDAPDPAIQDSAMKKLSIVGGKSAFRTFYRLLDDDSPRANPRCTADSETGRSRGECDVVFFSRSATAMYFLSRMVENPPANLADTSNRAASFADHGFSAR